MRHLGSLDQREDVYVDQVLARALLEADGRHVDVVDTGETAPAALAAGPS